MAIITDKSTQNDELSNTDISVCGSEQALIRTYDYITLWGGIYNEKYP